MENIIRTLYSLLMWQFLPLSVGDAERAARLHLAGMWLTFVVSAAMIAWFVARMTASIRERDSRLADAREQALRDEHALRDHQSFALGQIGAPVRGIEVAEVVEPRVEGIVDVDYMHHLLIFSPGISGSPSAKHHPGMEKL